MFHKNLKINSFTVWVTEHWNRLSGETMESCSLEIFKNLPGYSKPTLGNRLYQIVQLNDLQKSLQNPTVLWFSNGRRFLFFISLIFLIFPSQMTLSASPKSFLSSFPSCRFSPSTTTFFSLFYNDLLLWILVRLEKVRTVKRGVWWSVFHVSLPHMKVWGKCFLDNEPAKHSEYYFIPVHYSVAFCFCL